jgi:hypothetical protein
MKYLYETHLHTCEASACADAYGSDYIQGYIDKGYTGIIVTDHFYRGNSSLDRRLPWRKWVDEFCRGYEEARNEGEKYGLDVFFGWEETYDGDDYLIYGLDKQWLLEHPEVRSWNRNAQYESVKRYGGCVVHAHPFRQHYYISCINLSPYCIDAVEAANAGNHLASYDALAMRYARKLGLPATAGSDIHDTEQIDSGDLFGVYLDKKMNSIADYVAAIRNKTIAGLAIPPGRCDSTGKENLTLPLEIRDKEDRILEHDLQTFL